MIASSLISDNVPSVKSTDSAWSVLGWMSEFKIYQLPVVDEGLYVGMISEDDILDAADLMLPISEIQYPARDRIHVHESDHIYQAVSAMNNFQMEILPVLSDNNEYLGIITLRDIVTRLGTLFALQEPGGVIVLEIPQNSYMLSEIGRITESENAKVLSLYISPTPSSQTYYATLKVNIEDLSRLVASFNRFEYNVVKTYFRAEQLQNYQRNLDALMNYLDI